MHGERQPAAAAGGRLGIGAHRLSRIESGSAEPTPHEAAAIALLLNPIAAETEPAPTPVEDALIALVRAATSSGWEIVIRRSGTGIAVDFEED